MLQPPGLREIKQVELYTKYRKYVPEQWQDETCPRPADAVLEKFKVEKNEKMRSHLEKKKDKYMKHLEECAKKASEAARARYLADQQQQLPHPVFNIPLPQPVFNNIPPDDDDIEEKVDDSNEVDEPTSVYEA